MTRPTRASAPLPSAHSKPGGLSHLREPGRQRMRGADRSVASAHKGAELRSCCRRDAVPSGGLNEVQEPCPPPTPPGFLKVRDRKEAKPKRKPKPERENKAGNPKARGIRRGPTGRAWIRSGLINHSRLGLSVCVQGSDCRLISVPDGKRKANWSTLGDKDCIYDKRAHDVRGLG